MTDSATDTPDPSKSKAKLGTLRALWPFVRQHAGLFAAWLCALALASAFIGLHWLGVPANLISMGAIDFGILVDGAVVLVENVEFDKNRDKDHYERNELPVRPFAFDAGLFHKSGLVFESST